MYKMTLSYQRIEIPQSEIFFLLNFVNLEVAISQFRYERISQLSAGLVSDSLPDLDQILPVGWSPLEQDRSVHLGRVQSLRKRGFLSNQSVELRKDPRKEHNTHPVGYPDDGALLVSSRFVVLNTAVLQQGVEHLQRHPGTVLSQPDLGQNMSEKYEETPP